MRFPHVKKRIAMVHLIAALLIGSIGSVGLAGALLLLNKNVLEKITTYLLSLAGGTLLGAAFLGMLPKAISYAEDVKTVLTITLLGIVALFMLEKIILWNKCGNKNCERQKDASAQLILIGDAFHNFIDGVIITAAFLSSPSFGWFITFTVLAHEIPQELSDFGILLRNGYSRKKALIYNLLSGSTAIIGGIIAYFALELANAILPFVLSISAASFIYIALADLVPQMHQKTKFADSIIQVILIIIGIAVIFFLKRI